MKKEFQLRGYYILVILTSMIVFVLLYGWRVLNPLYDDWLLRGSDLTQHYLGWCFYRRGAWTFPIGLTDNLAYPDYSSVIYTDSIPLFAVFFKVLSPILPETFQYFGLWGIISFVMQGLFCVKILLEFRVNKVQAYIASFLFMVSPIVIERMYRHTALGAHWIILASIYLFIRHKKDYDNIKMTTICWGIIGALMSAIHMYYLPMCGMFLGGYVLCSLIKSRKILPKYFLPVFSFIVGLFGNAYLLGGFSTRANASSDGLGDSSFNLNGFFNAKGYSKILPALKTHSDGQYEGFAYLGLGIFILLIFVVIYILICFIKKEVRHDRDFIMYMIMYILMSIGLIAFAASPQVTFNDRLIFTYPYSSTLTHYWSIFRSTGRIVWPVCYLIYIGAVICNSRLWEKSNKKYIAPIIIGVCTAIQLWDISGKLEGARERYAVKVEYESPLKNEIWNKISDIDSFEHIVWVSPHFQNNEIMIIAKFAQDNQLTMNNYYFARPIGVVDNVKREMENLDDACIYIFRPQEPEGIEEYGLYLYEADDYIIGTTFDIE